MQTCSTSVGSTASTSRTACRRSTRRTSTSASMTSCAWSTSRSRSSTSRAKRMLSLRRGHVTAVVERHEGLARLEVDGTPCIAYPNLTGPVALGDEVLVNVQARGLALGSGGFDVLYANLTRGLELPAEDRAHVMKLPYTPLQFAVRHGEEDSTFPDRLDGLPVVACSLHSQVAPVCAALGGLKVAYVQVSGGALPIALSDALRELRAHDLLHVTIGSGECFGGDADAVNVYSALLLARARERLVRRCVAERLSVRRSRGADDRGRRRGLAPGMRRPSARPHGPRPRGRPVVLRRRLCGGGGRPRARRGA